VGVGWEEEYRDEEKGRRGEAQLGVVVGGC
jgi:hypothetical protein